MRFFIDSNQALSPKKPKELLIFKQYRYAMIVIGQCYIIQL
jgi:hypothetical protein